jgi:hypothetical protein
MHSIAMPNGTDLVPLVAEEQRAAVAGPEAHTGNAAANQQGGYKHERVHQERPVEG